MKCTERRDWPGELFGAIPAVFACWFDLPTATLVCFSVPIDELVTCSRAICLFFCDEMFPTRTQWCRKTGSFWNGCSHTCPAYEKKHTHCRNLNVLPCTSPWVKQMPNQVGNEYIRSFKAADCFGFRESIYPWRTQCYRLRTCFTASSDDVVTPLLT